ncbi:MAG: prolyl oligopeptidase [Olpidium bornovanus]|uniref:Prolyl oligopeptidase n=1 Tax=Olpidium bornovanus TaxID=278681 RepID=A0A8H8DIR4_9FUNG|nr:MAG: prolyl oligopeptidase [Olpidium bornovanus]
MFATFVRDAHARQASLSLVLPLNRRLRNFLTSRTSELSVTSRAILCAKISRRVRLPFQARQLLLPVPKLRAAASGIDRRGNCVFYFACERAILTFSGIQSVLWQFKSLEDEPTSFLDPNTLEADGTAALSTYGFSDDGKLFAYGISRSGSDWISVHVKETTPGGKTYDDIIEWCKFTGLSWTHDNKGFFYNVGCPDG